tara:strand:- start:5044 stop:6297 length:1254 start_codon:yes stop_codon:yes gene_type:complete
MKTLISIEYDYLDNEITNPSLSDDYFSFKKAGIFAYSGDWNTQQIETDNVIEKVLNNKFDKNYFTNNVNSLYRLPNLTLSRDKVANFKDECNFKVTRDKNKADICVIGKKTITKLTESTYRNPITLNELKRNAENLIHKHKLKQNEIDVLKNLIFNIRNEFGEDVIIHRFSNNYWYNHDCVDPYTKKINNTLEHLFEYDSSSNHRSRNHHYTYYVKNENIELYKWLYDNTDKMILDTELNKLCVEDSVVLSKDEFERLTDLVRSTDEENVNIGLTLMANCNVEESKTYLSLLFAFNSDNMKGRKVWNHVNFKYLRTLFNKYINMSLSNWGHAYDNLIKCMVEDKCLTLWSSRYIATRMFTNVLENNFGIKQNDTVFTISVNDLKLKPEFEEQLVGEHDDKLSELITAGVSHNDDLPF